MYLVGDACSARPWRPHIGTEEFYAQILFKAHHRCLCMFSRSYQWHQSIICFSVVCYCWQGGQTWLPYLVMHPCACDKIQELYTAVAVLLSFIIVYLGTIQGNRCRVFRYTWCLLSTLYMDLYCLMQPNLGPMSSARNGLIYHPTSSTVL